MKKTRKIFLLVLVAILSGCATLYTGQKIDAGDVSVRINLPPVMYAGVKMKDYAKAEEFVVVMNDFLLNCEYHKFRLSWDVLAIDENLELRHGVVIADLKEKSPNGLFYANGKAFVPSRNARVIVLASNASLGFDAYGKTIVIYEHLLGDKAYRKELYEKGTSLSELPNPGVFNQKIAKWNRFRTPFGNLLTPWSIEIITDLAKINTGYTAGERAKEGKWGAYTNPIATGFGLIRDSGYTLLGNSHGWDIDSKSRGKESELSYMILQEARQTATIRVYKKGD